MDVFLCIPGFWHIDYLQPRRPYQNRSGAIAFRNTSVYPNVAYIPSLLAGFAKDIRATVGCAVRTIPNKNYASRTVRMAHPALLFITPFTGEGLFLEFTGSELQNHRQTARYP